MLEVLAGFCVALLLVPPLLLGLCGFLLMAARVAPGGVRARATVTCPLTQRQETAEIAGADGPEVGWRVHTCTGFPKGSAPCKRCEGMKQGRWRLSSALTPRFSLIDGGIATDVVEETSPGRPTSSG